ncbi:hypothetical protein CEXT_808321 [Caerostris extrusa]|uniref:Uncharacterized protein n=1 Tax=Caerostris extrusa TaxID=172846 RepID=A0AAV4N7A0_CAEEX|nr:hypothetical protein CEXT_808321 [Caerostris extrusa]
MTPESIDYGPRDTPRPPRTHRRSSSGAGDFIFRKGCLEQKKKESPFSKYLRWETLRRLIEGFEEAGEVTGHPRRRMESRLGETRVLSFQFGIKLNFTGLMGRFRAQNCCVIQRNTSEIQVLNSR